MPDEPFFHHLKAEIAHHVLIVGETEDFDQAALDLWTGEDFQVTYVPLGEGDATDFRSRLHATADRVVGVSERYIIVAYQDAADAVLSAAKTSMPRLVGVIAYYPSVIPDPTRTTYSPGLHVLLHTCGQNINVERRPEVLGIQGKPKIVEKELPNGSGVGQEIHLKQAAMKRSVVEQGDFRLYNYPGCETGFSESDLDDFDESARNIAWSRSLRLARAAFGIVDEYSLEAIRDAFVDDVKAGRQDPKTVQLWVNGRLMTVHAALYYRTISTYSQKNIKLVSRTTGADQVVDELDIDLVDGPEDWMALPVSKNATTNKIRLVSITTIRAGQPIREKVLWYDA